MNPEELVSWLKAGGLNSTAVVVDELIRSRAVFQERLAKSGERENQLRAMLTDAQNECGRLQNQLSRMEEHPDVRRARREKLEQQAEALHRQIAELSDKPAVDEKE